MKAAGLPVCITAGAGPKDPLLVDDRCWKCHCTRTKVFSTSLEDTVRPLAGISLSRSPSRSDRAWSFGQLRSVSDLFKGGQQAIRHWAVDEWPMACLLKGRS